MKCLIFICRCSLVVEGLRLLTAREPKIPREFESHRRLECFECLVRKVGLQQAVNLPSREAAEGSIPSPDSFISGGRIVAIPLALGARYREFDSRSPD